MAYSSGFNPHPRISYAGAAPTGSASEAEYLEIALAEVLDPLVVKTQLDAALPEGLDVLDVVESPGGSLSDRLEASQWQITLGSVPAERAAEAVTAFLSEDEVVVERMTKKGLRSFNCRDAVLSLSVRAEGDAALLDLVLRHGTPSVRPDDVLTGLRATGGLEVPGTPLQCRIAQGPVADDGSLTDPFA